MAAGVRIDEDTVALSLDRLIRLLDEVEQMTTTVSAAREQQTGAWPEIASVQAFVRRYRESLRVAADDLDAIRATIGHLHQALVDSTRSLRDLDEDVKDRLMRLANRLSDADPAPSAQAAGTGGLGTQRSSGHASVSAPRRV